MITFRSSTGDYLFAGFGTETMGWIFTATINLDAAVVTWKLFSIEIPGDPPNG